MKFQSLGVLHDDTKAAERETRGAYHLTEKSGWGVESIMVSDLPVYRRNATSVRV